MRKLKEKLIRSKNVFKGKLLDVFKDDVKLPNGNNSTREFIKHPGASACIPLLNKSDIVLVKQYRYSLRKEMLEIPAGKLDKMERPEDCASRELEEEIGYQTNKLTLLTKIHPAVGFCNEVIWLYIAEELTETSIKPDKDEFIELVPTKIEDAIDMIKTGIISDAKTIISLLWYDKYYLK